MYLPAGQHPYLAVLVPRLSKLNALLVPVNVFHLLPHKVRLNPLSLNTTNCQCRIREKKEKKRKKKKVPVKVRDERRRIQKRKRVGIECYVLFCMLVVLETSHFEMSELYVSFWSNK